MKMIYNLNKNDNIYENFINCFIVLTKSKLVHTDIP